MNCNIRTTSTCLLVLSLVCVDDVTAAPTDTKSVVVIGAATETEASGASELSVMPLDQIEYPENRPDWITSFATQHGVDYPDAKTIIVVSKRFDTPEACRDYIAVTKRAAIQEYVSRSTDSLVGQSDFTKRFQFAGFYTIADEEIEDLTERTYEGTVQEGGMKMHEQAVELVIPLEKRQEIEAAWSNAQVGQRLQQMLGLAVTGLVLLIGSAAVVGTISRRVERRDRLTQPH